MKLHHAHYRNHRVVVILRDGSRIIDRFVSTHHNYLILEKQGRIPFKRIQALAPYRAALGNLEESDEQR